MVCCAVLCAKGSGIHFPDVCTTQIASKIVESFDSHGLSPAQIARSITDGIDTADAEEHASNQLQAGAGGEESSTASMPVSGVTSETRESDTVNQFLVIQSD
jgi:hypothetical protein